MFPLPLFFLTLKSRWETREHYCFLAIYSLQNGPSGPPFFKSFIDLFPLLFYFLPLFLVEYHLGIVWGPQKNKKKVFRFSYWKNN